MCKSMEKIWKNEFQIPNRLQEQEQIIDYRLQEQINGQKGFICNTLIS